MHLEKLFNEILLQLKEESKKYKKLKICKYSFEISKVAILSLATGLSFINIFAILQQRSYFVLITIVSMYGISNTSHQIRYKVYEYIYFVSDLMRCIANTIH